MKFMNVWVKVLLSMAFIGSLLSFTNGPKSKKELLRHVVCFQFKEEVSQERRNQAIEDFLDLKNQIPEIKKFEGGQDISVEGMNQGFTHCYVLTFESEADRDIYIPHPAHIQLAEKNKPLMSDLIVIDFWGEE